MNKNGLWIVFAILLAVPATMFAADQNYDDASSDNIWDTSTENWDSGVAWTNGNSAIFGGTGETVAVDTVTANGITFNSSGYTLNSGTITLSDSTITANNDVTIASALAGNSTLTKNGAGTLRITANNSYSGATTVDGGTLQVAARLRNTAGMTVNSGATLDLGAGNMFTSGHGAAMDDSRVLTADGGTLLMNGDMVSRIGNVHLKNGGTFTSNKGMGGWDVLLGDTDDGAATVSVSGNAASTMNGSGGIHLQGMQNFDVADVTGNSDADLTVSMELGNPGWSGGDNGGIKKLGDGTLILNTNNTFTGGVTVDQGTVRAQGDYSTRLAEGNTVTINDGGTFEVYSVNSVNLAQDWVVNEGGTLLYSDNHHAHLAGTLSLNGGTIQGTGSGKYADEDFILEADVTVGGTAASTITLANGMGLDGNRTFTVADVTGDSSADLLVNGEMENTGSLVKTGLGTMELSGANTFAGNIGIDAGILALTGAGTLGAGTYEGSITNNGSLVVNTSGGQHLNGTISGTGGIVKQGDNALYMTGTNSYSGVTDIQDGYLEVNGGSLDMSSSVLNIGSSADGNRAVDIWGGTLTVRGLTGGTSNTKIVSNGGRTLVVDTPEGESYSYDGILQNDTWSGKLLSFEKTGPGTQTLTGNNTYSGNTTISGGVLDLSGTGTIYNGAVKAGADSLVINGGGVLKADRWAWGNDNSLGKLNYNSGYIAVDNGTIRNVAASSTDFNNRGINVGAGGITYENATADTVWTINSGGNANSYADNAKVALSGVGNGAFQQVISGTGVNVEKSGSGTWTLSGANTYEGGTVIEAGTLALSGSGAISSSVTIDVQSGATLDVSGTSATYEIASGQTLTGKGTVSGNLSVESGATLSPGASPGTMNVTGDLTLDDANLAIDIWGATPDSDHDVIDISSGTLSLQNTPTITVDLGDAFNPDIGEEFTIVTGIDNWSGNWGELTVVNGDDFKNADKDFSIGQGSVMLTVIPEPATFGLLGLFGLVYLLRRRLNS